jgi:hypothetical protein
LLSSSSGNFRFGHGDMFFTTNRKNRQQSGS